MFKTIVVGVGSFGEKRARAVKESLLRNVSMKMRHLY
jgi:hypothetical protein